MKKELPRPPKTNLTSVTLYIGNLNYKITEKQLRGIFGKFSKVGRLKLIEDPKTRKSKGIAFVEVFGKENAQKAISALNGRPLDGRTAKVSIAEERVKTPPQTKRKPIAKKKKPLGLQSLFNRKK